MKALLPMPSRISKALVVGATVVLLLGAAIFGWRVANVSRALLERGIAATTGASVSLESGGFTLWQGLTLWATNFRVAWPEGSTNIEGRSLIVSVELLPLLERRVVVRQIVMEQGGVVFDERPVLTVKDHLERLPLVDLSRAGFGLKDVTLRYGGAPSSQGGEQGLSLEALTLQASPREGPHASISFSFSAENSGAGGPLPAWMPRVGGKGRLLLQGSEIVFDETVLSLGDLQVSGAGRWRLTEERFTLSGSQWSVQDVSFSLNGHAVVAGPGLTYLLHLSAPEVATSALRTVPPLVSLWSRADSLTTAGGAVGVELTLRPGKVDGTLTLHGVTHRLDDRLPPVTLTGSVAVENQNLELRKIQGRIGESLFDIEGRLEDALSSQWSMEVGIRSTLLFPSALVLVPPEITEGIETAGTVPVTGRLLATADGASLEISVALEGVERFDLFPLRKRTDSSGWLKTRTFWEAGKEVSTEIELSLSRGEVFSLPAEDLSAHALLEGGALEAESVRFSLDPGTVEGRARIESSIVEAEFRVREGEANVFVSRLLGAPDRFYGKLSMDVHLRNAGTSGRELLRGATGSIELVVENGRLEEMDLPARLLQMATLTHEGVVDFNFSRTFKALSPEPIDHFELLSARFDIADGVARTENLVFVAHNLGLQGKGTVDLASGAIDFLVEGQVPKETEDHAGLIDRAVGVIRIGKVLDLLRKIPGLDVVLGEIEKEHVFRLKLTGNLEGEKNVTDFAWVH